MRYSNISYNSKNYDEEESIPTKRPLRASEKRILPPNPILYIEENIDILCRITDKLEDTDIDILNYSLEGKTYTDISRVMGVTATTVRNRLTTVANKVRRYKGLITQGKV